jgi:hypothetical protein
MLLRANESDALSRRRASIRLALVLISGSAIHERADAMNSQRALALAQHWGKDVRDGRAVSDLVARPDGSFLTRAGGAFLRYEAGSMALKVSGLIAYNLEGLDASNSLWDDLLRLGNLESATLGEGTFELLREALFDLGPSVVLLTKTFKQSSIDPVQFSREVRWLLAAAHHWAMSRFFDAVSKSEQDLAVKRARILATWPKRPW